MKCELCHQADASEAIVLDGASKDSELYVCASCAAAERAKRQSARTRTRQVKGLPPGVSMRVTEVVPSSDDGSGEVPPLFSALMDAVQGLVGEIEKAHHPTEEGDEKRLVYPTAGAPEDLLLRGAFHLEGLHLISEIGAVKRAFHALGLELRGICSDGIADAGHLYDVLYPPSEGERVKRVVEDLLREEANARARLKTDCARVFSDSCCRALAILKNCRLLSPPELFDLLSPLRLAAHLKRLKGLSRREIEKMMTSLDLSFDDPALSPEDRDRVDAELADEMNARFERIFLDDVL